MSAIACLRDLLSDDNRRCLLKQAKVRDLVRCENWYPFYEITVHDAICYDGTYGLAWVS